MNTTSEHIEALAKRDERIDWLTQELVSARRTERALREQLAKVVQDRDHWHSKANKIPY